MVKNDTDVSDLSSFLGHEVLKEQAKLIRPMQEAGVKLFVPSDLALPYTDEERTNVQVPRDKGELEQELKANEIPFVVICIGNFTSFALDSPCVIPERDYSQLANEVQIHGRRYAEQPHRSRWQKP